MSGVPKCPHGHDRTPENTGANGRCLPCHRDRELARNRRNGIQPRPTATDTHCAKGHPWAEDNNLYVEPSGRWSCRACNREVAARYRASVKAGKKVEPAAERVPRTACRHGHQWPEHEVVRKDGKSECRECNRIRAREYNRGRAKDRKPRERATHCGQGHEIAVVGRYKSGKCKACSADYNRENPRTRVYAPRPRKPKAAPKPRPSRAKFGYCNAGTHRMTEDNKHTDPIWGEQCLKCLERANPKRSATRDPGASLPPLVGDTTITPEIAARARRTLIRLNQSDLAEMLGLTEGTAA